MKPKIGLFLIGCERFRALGTDTARGDYAARKDRFAEQFVKNLGDLDSCTRIVLHISCAY